MHAFLSPTKVSVEYLPIPIPQFGDWTRQRRITVGLNCARAAAAVGIDLAEWKALEQGWVPTTKNSYFLRALASTLEIRYDDLVYVIVPLESHFADIND